MILTPGVTPAPAPQLDPITAGLAGVAGAVGLAGGFGAAFSVPTGDNTYFTGQ